MGSTVYAYNSGRRSLSVTVAGEGSPTVFAPQPIQRTSIKRNLSDSKVQVELPMTLQPAPQFLAQTPTTQIWLEVFKSDGTYRFRGKIIDLEVHKIKKGMCRLNVAAMGSVIDSELPTEDYQPTCRHKLGSSLIVNGSEQKCGIDLSLHELTLAVGTVSISGFDFTHADIADEADPWYAGGQITNGDQAAYIIRHVGDTVTLMNPFVGTPAGNFILTPGCDKLLPTCQTNFGLDNSLQYGGATVFTPKKDVVLSGF